MGDKLSEMIERAIASAPPLCAGLIDQGRKVGGDPVGHSCGNVATERYWVGGLSWPVCASCAGGLREDSGRVTLPWWRAQPGEG